MWRGTLDIRQTGRKMGKLCNSAANIVTGTSDSVVFFVNTNVFHSKQRSEVHGKRLLSRTRPHFESAHVNWIFELQIRVVYTIKAKLKREVFLSEAYPSAQGSFTASVMKKTRRKGKGRRQFCGLEMQIKSALH